MLSRQIAQVEDLATAKDKAASIEDMAVELVTKYRRQAGLAA
jgi:hypothetical protein